MMPTLSMRLGVRHITSAACFRACVVVLSIAAIATAEPLISQERILSYDSEVDIRADGSIDVAEHITVRAEGNSIRRGIYRDFPTRYRDRYGNRVRVDIGSIHVERNGVPEPWFTERLTNGVRINTGNDDLLPVPAEYTFTIRYRTTRQLGFFDDHDELYWNAIGTGWDFAIESGSVVVRLPEPVPADQLGAEAYTGFQGTQGSDYTASFPAAGTARYELTRQLAPREGMTVVLTFPKGIVAAPTTAERIRWFFSDNGGALVAVAGLLTVLLYCFLEWRRVGRDPRKGVIIPHYQPREGMTPASLRYMQRMGYDMRCFSSDVLSLAVGGYLEISRDKGFLKDEWRLDRSAEVGSSPPMAVQQSLLSGIFSSGPSLVLKNTNASAVQRARTAHNKALDHTFHPHYFKRNGRSLIVPVLIIIVTAALAIFLSGGFGLLIIALAIGAMIITTVVFGFLVRAPTREGRVLLDEIEGLKLYLGVAERDELAGMKGPGDDGPPELDAKRYEELLPYAVALEVEDAWTKKFTAAVGAAAAATAAAGISWYHGHGSVSNLGEFSKAVGSSLSSTISSASSPPGSSSGSGGGGSSGGGGGGGGGGGR